MNRLWKKIASGVVCVTFGAMVSLPASAGIINLEATLDGAQAMAGAGSGSAGTGVGLMEFDDATNVFSWLIVWENLNAPAVVAHFHGAALPNQNAGVQVGIVDLTSPSVGSAIIDAAQAADLLAGSWYINIHTPFNLGGEIRGQVSVGGDGIPVPEPSTLALLGAGLLGLFMRRKRVA